MSHMLPTLPDCRACLPSALADAANHNEQPSLGLHNSGPPFSHLRSREPTMNLTHQARCSSSPSLPSIPFPGLSNVDHTCLDCIAECNDLCPSADAIKTSMCTDQCVVVACDDPEHATKMCCHQESSHLQCEYACDTAEGCSDCTGWDKLCCADNTPYPTDQVRPATSNLEMSWDSCLVDFLCECGEFVGDSCIPTHNYSDQLPPSSSITESTASTPSLGSTPSNCMDDSLFNVSDPTPIHPSPFSQTSSPSPISSRPSNGNLAGTPAQGLLQCMWGDCQVTFSTLSDLVGHVNLQHLRLPAPDAEWGAHQQSLLYTTIPTAHAQANPSQFCPWRNCRLSPESIPGPSKHVFRSMMGDQHSGALGFLVNHLLQDHLGLPAPGLHRISQPVDQEVNTSTTHISPAISAVELDIGPPVNGPCVSTQTAQLEVTQQCHSSHPCLWVGCGMNFPVCNELTAHLTVAHVGSGKAQYECYWENCNRNGENGFGSKQKICRHLQSHTGHRPFQCQLCQQNFSEAATLQQHMRRHTQEKPYVCNYPNCGKSFAITGALTIHKRTHNGQKPFKCTYCDRAFAESSNLSKHLRTHTGARPYSCLEPGCGKSFARPDQLTRHVGVHKRKQSVPDAVTSKVN
ncbi:hypothetical protein BDN72DRAFT_425210 [Pluteus cervinus]|uniref:Uncharacterized protein n=1 Tax=Pluteus cervinus TaxID=181527 RepID=A0ACD3B013_9AGAR|nr:hypothetical protein BDN72DRAFT_425210 [Pluteus cervinus]